MSLFDDVLTLVSTDPQSPIRFDPRYVYVNAGETFGRDHAAFYADADTARISFGNATTAMEHILRNSGSAYLPLRLAACAVNDGRLFPVSAAPTFIRAVHVMHNTQLKDRSQWFATALEWLTQYARSGNFSEGQSP